MKIWNKIRQKRTETDKNPKESGHEKDNWLERHLLGDMSPIDFDSDEYKKKEEEIAEIIARQGYINVMTQEARAMYTDEDIDDMIRNAEFSSGGHHYASPAEGDK